jgi:TPR repeat protein
VLLDESNAVQYLRRASEQDFSDAQILLSCLLLTGQRVKRNGTEAYMWALRPAVICWAASGDQQPNP